MKIVLLERIMEGEIIENRRKKEELLTSLNQSETEIAKTKKRLEELENWREEILKRLEPYEEEIEQELTELKKRIGSD